MSGYPPTQYGYQQPQQQPWPQQQQQPGPYQSYGVPPPPQGYPPSGFDHGPPYAAQQPYPPAPYPYGAPAQNQGNQWNQPNGPQGPYDAGGPAPYQNQQPGLNPQGQTRDAFPSHQSGSNPQDAARGFFSSHKHSHSQSNSHSQSQQQQILGSEEVAMYLSRHNCIQIPPAWQPLPRAIRTYYPLYTADNWLAHLEMLEFHSVPDRTRSKFSKKEAKSYSGPVFKFKIDEDSPWYSDTTKYHWKVYDSHDKALWRFRLKEKDSKGKDGSHKSKVDFQAGKDTDVDFEFGDGAKTNKGYDSLAFTNPHDGVRYVWRTDRHISMLNGWRSDFVRYALFRNHSHASAELVADVAIWDGDADDPDEAVSVRAQDLDDSMVVATYVLFRELLLDEVLRVEKAQHPNEFATSEEQARQTKLGKAAHWQSGEGAESTKSKILDGFIEGLAEGAAGG